MRSQGTWAPLFKLRDTVTKVKIQVDETLDSSGAIVIPDDDSEAGHSGWGEKTVSTVFKPLPSPPQIDIQTKYDELQLDDLDSDPDTVNWQPRREPKLYLIRSRSLLTEHWFTPRISSWRCTDSLSSLANVTSNSVCVYLKLFSITNTNQRRLVRSKMSNIFKPKVKWALNQNT